jgi:tetrahydromethanopterin S-methyltransferase subunit B
MDGLTDEIDQLKKNVNELMHNSGMTFNKLNSYPSNNTRGSSLKNI